MSEETERQKTLAVFLVGTSACDPGKSFCPLSVQFGPGDVPLIQPGNFEDTDTIPRLPEIDFSDRAWRDASLVGKAEVPAGYTYFGQLIGHDLGHSMPIEQVPYTQRNRVCQEAPNAGNIPSRYNVIENPLTLETLYGSGPAMLPHLFDHKTYLFRIHKGSIITIAHSGTDPSIRAIYDSRNRDTNILHRLAAIWMKFHNQIALQFHAALEQDLGDDPKRKAVAYSMARTHVLTVWHHLIKTDFLPRFVDPEIMALSNEELERYEALDETSLLHGLFRSFHALPRRKYKFPELRKLGDLLLQSLSHDERAESSWPLDWKLFFENNADGTKAGLCASFSPSFTPNQGVKISMLDLATAKSARPLMLESENIQNILKLMPTKWRDRLTPKSLAEAFTSIYASNFDKELTADEVKRSPLFLILMIEAQLYGKSGRFGPLGSILLRRAIMQAISQIRYTKPDSVVPDLPRPNSMLELISLTAQ